MKLNVLFFFFFFLFFFPLDPSLCKGTWNIYPAVSCRTSRAASHSTKVSAPRHTHSHTAPRQGLSRSRAFARQGSMRQGRGFRPDCPVSVFNTQPGPMSPAPPALPLGLVAARRAAWLMLVWVAAKCVVGSSNTSAFGGGGAPDHRITPYISAACPGERSAVCDETSKWC